MGARFVGNGPRPECTGDHTRTFERSRDVLGGVPGQGGTRVQKQQHVPRRGGSGIELRASTTTRTDDLDVVLLASSSARPPSTTTTSWSPGVAASSPSALSIRRSSFRTGITTEILGPVNNRYVAGATRILTERSRWSR